jgi:hypothetical protein
MIRPFTGVRARRTVVALWTASSALLLSGLGAVPAAASGGTVTETGWIPLGCNIAGSADATNTNFTGGVGVHIATALKATHPVNLTPGETFKLTAVSAVQVVPPAAQTSGAVFGPVNGFEGVVTDFENNLANATSNFSPGSSNGGLQVNQVQALQPTNDDTIPPGTGVTTTGDDKAFVSPDASDPSPIDMWAEQGSPAGSAPVPATDPSRQHVYSFGPIPINSSGSATVNAYGPAPGENGGPNVTDGIPRPLGTGLTVGGPVNHFTTTGTAGQNVVMDVGDSTRHVTNTISHVSNAPLIALAIIAFNDPTPPTHHAGVDPGTWGSTLPVACGVDNSPSPLPPPAPGYCTNAPGTLPDVPTGCFVAKFTIPIVSGTVVPEAPIAVLLPLAGLLVVGTWLVYRRRQATTGEVS